MTEDFFTVADYLAAQRLHQRRRYMVAFIVEGSLLLLGTLMLIRTQDPVAIFAFTVFLGLFLLVPVTWFLVLPRRSRRHVRQMKLDKLQIRFHWDEEALSSESEQGHGRKPWRDYLKSRADQHIVLLYHADNLFTMIPARWFDSAAERAEFLRLAGKAGG